METWAELIRTGASGMKSEYKSASDALWDSYIEPEDWMAIATWAASRFIGTTFYGALESDMIGSAKRHRGKVNWFEILEKAESGFALAGRAGARTTSNTEQQDSNVQASQTRGDMLELK